MLLRSGWRFIRIISLIVKGNKGTGGGSGSTVPMGRAGGGGEPGDESPGYFRVSRWDLVEWGVRQWNCADKGVPKYARVKDFENVELQGIGVGDERRACFENA